VGKILQCARIFATNTGAASLVPADAGMRSVFQSLLPTARTRCREEGSSWQSAQPHGVFPAGREILRDHHERDTGKARLMAY
jgi:hypothetical protein